MPEHDEQTAETIAEKAVAGQPRTATFADLRRKPRRKLSFSLTTADEAGEPLEIRMTFQALNSKEYDDLIAAHPPKKGKENTQVYNAETFFPALLAAVSYEPKLTLEEATEIYRSDEWSAGEMMTLQLNAQNVCGAGLDVPFTERG
jgi:hypothetical protein